MKLVKFAHFEPVRQKARPQRLAWPPNREYLATRVKAEESSDHHENMWPSHIFRGVSPTNRILSSRLMVWLTSVGSIGTGTSISVITRPFDCSGCFFARLSELDSATALAAIADDGDQFEGNCFLIGPDGLRRFRLTRKA